MKVGDKVALLKWGIFVLTQTTDSEGKPSFKAKLDPNDKDFKTPPKLTWLPDRKELLYAVNVIEYDHLLTCKKPDDENDFTKFVNSNSKFVTPFYAEGFLQNMPERAYIQFERRGFFIIDKKRLLGNSREQADCIYIPDGKTKTMSGLSQKIDAKKLTKGE